MMHLKMDKFESEDLNIREKYTELYDEFWDKWHYSEFQTIHARSISHTVAAMIYNTVSRNIAFDLVR